MRLDELGDDLRDDLVHPLLQRALGCEEKARGREGEKEGA